MTDLQRRARGERGKVHELTPSSAGWSYVGFSLYRLQEGDEAAEFTADREVMLVLVEGMAEVGVDERDLGLLGGRMDVFDRQAPHAVYVPRDTSWTVTATSDCTLAVCSAPARTKRDTRVIGPRDIACEARGSGSNLRHIHAIAMEERDCADSLLVTEVYTPAGHWSSYPPHRHDEDDFPRMTYLEETYYHRINPAQGFAFQRVYTEDGSLDQTMSVGDHDVVLVPKGHHPCAAPHGYDLYYLNVMAGPQRKWRFRNDPSHEWLLSD